MSKIQSVKGVKEMYKHLQNTAGLVAYDSKSPEFKRVIENEKDLIRLYEDILLNGSQSEMYQKLIMNIDASNQNEKMHIFINFQQEIVKDIDTITKKSHMIRTNECPKDKLYYNGTTVKEMLGKMSNFMCNPDFYEKLTPENKKVLQNFLKVEDPNIDLADPEYEVKYEKMLREECDKVMESDLLPFIERVMSDEDFAQYLQLSSRIANKQIDPKNVPTKLIEQNLDISNNDVANLYELVEFMTEFEVAGEFEPEKIKEELCLADSHNVHSADKSIQLTALDIKTIFANADKFNKKDMMLTPVIMEGQIFAQPSDSKLRLGSNMSYEQAINAIKSGLEDIQAGAKYDTLDPNIAKYVKFLNNNCPTAEFLPNINLAEAQNCRLAKGHEANKTYEPVGEVKKYLVDGPRFTRDNIELMVNRIIEKEPEETKEKLQEFFKDGEGNFKLRIDTIARAMNREVDSKFLDKNEMIAMQCVEEYFHDIEDEKERKECITSKEDYKNNGHTLLSKNDLKILFKCFEANIENNPQFKMFKISEKDFEESKNGKQGKMLQRFGCSYEEFFDELYNKYKDAYEQKGIFSTGDDKYTPFLRYILGYCKDITYAPAVGMTTAENAEEPVYEPEEDSFGRLYSFTSGSVYSKLVLSLPSARDVPALDTSLILDDVDPRIRQKLVELKEQREKLIAKKENIEAKLSGIREKAKDRELTPNEIKITNFLMGKIREMSNQITVITKTIDETQKRIDKSLENVQKAEAKENSATQQTPMAPGMMQPGMMPPGMMPPGVMPPGMMPMRKGGFFNRINGAMNPYMYGMGNSNTAQMAEMVDDAYDDHNAEMNDINEDLERVINQGENILKGTKTQSAQEEDGKTVEGDSKRVEESEEAQYTDEELDEIVENNKGREYVFDAELEEELAIYLKINTQFDEDLVEIEEIETDTLTAKVIAEDDLEEIYEEDMEEIMDDELEEIVEDDQELRKVEDLAKKKKGINQNIQEEADENAFQMVFKPKF